MKAQYSLWGNVAILTLAILLIVPMIVNATAPDPIYGSATVDGQYSSDWNLTTDHFRDMWRAGIVDGTLEGKTYVKYDCSTGILYVLALANTGLTIDTTPSETWVEIARNNKKTKEVNGSAAPAPAAQPNFALVRDGSDNAIGFEASFELEEGYFKIQIHFNVYDGGSQTASTGKDGTLLNIECGDVTLGNKVWYDKDEDGLQEEGEQGVAGVTVTVYPDGSTTALKTTTTDAGGNYLFQGLAPGSYYVKFTTVPSMYNGFTTQNVGSDESLDSDANSSGQTASVTLVENQVYLDLDAGLTTNYGSIGDYVWLDTDKDGIQDDGETSVDGVTVKLYTADDLVNAVATTVTANGGKYLFSELEPDDYVVEVVPGDYVITSKNQGGDTGLDSDVSTTSPYRTGTIDLTADNTDDMTWDIGLVYEDQFVVLGDRVWIDANANGVQDAGEIGVEGATVELLLDGNATSYSDVTDALGLYEIQLLVDSNNDNLNKYSLRFTLPNGLQFTTADQGGNDATDSDVINATNNVGTTTTFSCNVAGNYLKWDAGAVAYSSIGNYVWLDQGSGTSANDENGIQDSGENGIDGITVQLLESDGTTIKATTVTSGGGYYLFDNLLAGTYFIKVVPGDYMVSPQDANGNSNNAVDSDVHPTTYKTASISLPANTDDDSQDIGLYVEQIENVILGDYVWLDYNGDGVQEEGEPGLAGVTVTLLLNGSPVPDRNDVTDANGGYQISLPVDTDTNNEGDYSLRFELPDAGLTFSTANNTDDDKDSDVINSSNGVGTTTTFSCNVAGSYLIWDAGVTNLGSIGNYVWFDADHDGTQDGTEAGVNGITVELLNSSQTVIASTITSNNGSNNGAYLFNHLIPGDYYIQIKPGGYSITLQNVGSDVSDSDVGTASPYRTGVINLSAGENDLTWDAGLYYSQTTVTLGDRVWIDYDNDGIQDVGEPGVEGVTVRLRKDQGQDPIQATTTTDANGNWIISGITPQTGTFYLEFLNIPTGYSFSSQQDQGGNDELDSDVSTSGIATPVPINDAGVYMNWDAAIVATYGSIGNYVWEDTDADGIQDGTEDGIDGITVQLLDSDGTTVLATDVTSGGGLYLFDNLVAGTYYVKVLPGTYTVSPKDAGGDDTADSDIDKSTYMTDAITLTAGENDLTQDAGLYYLQPNQIVKIGDYVWIDSDEDGVQDTNEPGLEGVTVELLLNGATTGYSDETDADGNYLIQLPVDNNNDNVGDYTLRFTLPNTDLRFTNDGQGTEATDSDVVGSSTHVGSTAGFSCNIAGSYLTWDAGVVNFSSIGNYVWLDQGSGTSANDENGIQDNGEDGIDGITVQLLDASANVLATQVTSNGGYYLFDNLVPGNYYVQVNPDGYAVSPKDANSNSDDTIDSDANLTVLPGGYYRTDQFSLAANTDDLTRDFGLYVDQTEKVILGDYVWFDSSENGLQDQGEIPIANVKVELIRSANPIPAEEGGPIVAYTNADGIWQIEFPVDTDPAHSGDYALVFYAPDYDPATHDEDDPGWEDSKWIITTQNIDDDVSENLDSDISPFQDGWTNDPFLTLNTAGVYLNYDAGFNIRDWGDAPDNPLQVSNNGFPYSGQSYNPYVDGASHTIIPNFYLGGTVDADPDALEGDGAQGDDTEILGGSLSKGEDNDPGDDEDGVAFLRTITANDVPTAVFVQGKPEVITVTAEIPTGKKGYLDVFLDYDGDYGWIKNTDPLVNENWEEHLIAGLELVDGSQQVTLNISDNVEISGTYLDTYIRFRFSSVGDLMPWGHQVDGEVEDYAVRILKDTDDDGEGDDDEPEGDEDNYAPSGWIYNEVTGEIISGGYITITSSDGGEFILEQDGSFGFYEFYITKAGTFTISYTPPEGYNPGVLCTAQTTTLDPQPYSVLSEPYIVGDAPEITLDGRYLPDPESICTNNPLYTTLYLLPGDQPVQLNNIPVSEEPISVDLTSFAAIEKDGQVEVSWTVASTESYAGYNLYRKAVDEDTYVQVNADMIKSVGEAQDYVYRFLDTPPTTGQYWYKLEVISLDGKTKTLGTVMTTVLSTVDANVIPKEFALYQNYPNPFNPTTTIQYDLPKDSYVTIDIYDILGTRVKRLVNKNVQAGAQSVVWDATNDFGAHVSTGIYMYRITAGDFSKIHKMILMK